MSEPQLKSWLMSRRSMFKLVGSVAVASVCNITAQDKDYLVRLKEIPKQFLPLLEIDESYGFACVQVEDIDFIITDEVMYNAWSEANNLLQMYFDNGAPVNETTTSKEFRAGFYASILLLRQKEAEDESR